MNFRCVLNQLGVLLLVVSAILALLGGWSAWQHSEEDPADTERLAERPAMMAFFFSASAGAVIGFLAWLLTCRDKGNIGRREAMLLVSVSWVVVGQLAALPYLLWAHLSGAGDGAHPFHSDVNCFFEAISGLTTTGATILSDIESLPRSIHLWRALTQWLGGLGIVVLFVAVLPLLGAGGKRLYRVEAPGLSPEGVKPHIRETARILWFIYMGLTVAQILSLWLVGLDWFDATCHTFTTLATAGFSTRNSSVGGLDSGAVEGVIIAFMVLAGVNFGLYYQLWRGRIRNVWKDVELRFYLVLILVAGVIVTLCILPQAIVTTTGKTLDPDAVQAVRHGFFTTVAIQTTTGFCTADFNQWPFVAKAVLITLMFVGGCGGSTSGGIKVIRIWNTIRVMLAEIEHAFRPSVVRPVKVGGAPLDPDLRLGAVAYVLGIVILFAIGSVTIMVLEPAESECTFATAASASLSTVCTIGPGIEGVGAVENYGWFTDASKLFMTLLMLIGRLEVFAIIVLFSPRFWARD